MYLFVRHLRPNLWTNYRRIALPTDVRVGILCWNFRFKMVAVNSVSNDRASVLINQLPGFWYEFSLRAIRSKRECIVGAYMYCTVALLQRNYFSVNLNES